MTRRRGLIVSGIAIVALLLAMAPAEQQMQDNGAGIVAFELAGGQERADEILDEWGDAGQDAAREQLLIDFAFLIAYGTFLVLAVAAVRDRLDRRGRTRLAEIGAAVVPFGAIAAACDAAENACLLAVLDDAGQAFPVLAFIFAATKFALLAAALAYLLVGIGLSLRRRPA
ncbi:MAG TPA: hypothetical protein VLI94_11585 [Solirubrobacterales bacterium]|nr:hypothetical protein [Solirubrobacterales bacterium]